jgi:hypothetical protein
MDSVFRNLRNEKKCSMKKSEPERNPKKNAFFGTYIKLIYLRSRDVRPRFWTLYHQRFMAGRLNRPISLNRWNYVEGNPVNRTDPSGQCLANQPLRPRSSARKHVISDLTLFFHGQRHPSRSP